MSFIGAIRDFNKFQQEISYARYIMYAPLRPASDKMHRLSIFYENCNYGEEH